MTTKERNNTGFHVSELPPSLAKMVGEFDDDGDGFIDEHEFTAALKTLRSSRNKNKAYGKIIVAMSCAILLLIGSMFGVSIAAARLAKDSTVDATNGFMYSKGGSHEVLKTGEATSQKPFDPSKWTTDDFMNTKYLLLNENKLSFAVKGYSISPSNNRTVFLVEGGTIVYDRDEVVEMTGNAQLLFEHAAGDESNRKLGRARRGSGSGFYGPPGPRG